VLFELGRGACQWPSEDCIHASGTAHAMQKSLTAFAVALALGTILPILEYLTLSRITNPSLGPFSFVGFLGICNVPPALVGVTFAWLRTSFLSVLGIPLGVLMCCAGVYAFRDSRLTDVMAAKTAAVDFYVFMFAAAMYFVGAALGYVISRSLRRRWTESSPELI
jgi:hypothetical protein